MLRFNFRRGHGIPLGLSLLSSMTQTLSNTKFASWSKLTTRFHFTSWSKHLLSDDVIMDAKGFFAK